MDNCCKHKKTVPSLFILGVLTLLLNLLSSPSANAQCINVYPHVEDFEAAQIWTSYQFYQANDWAWGTPAHPVINTAASGTKSWCLGGLTGAFYQYNEQSWVQSPCYDFTNLQYPHIWLKVFWESEWKYDGTKLQSSIDNGTTWQTVGAYLDPNDCNTANWYNTNATSSYSSGTITGGGAKPVWFPATDPTAKESWAGNIHPKDTADDNSHPGVTCYHGNGSGKWLVAQHCLTGLAGKPSVMFRMAFSCGYACNGYDGFAFDSVAVGNGIINTTTITPTCGGGTTMNFNSGAKACPTTTWAWNFGDGGTSTSENPSHTYGGPGVYTVSVIASGGACNPPDTATTVVHVLGVSITSFTNATCAIQGSATALATNGTTPTYTWSNGNSTATATGLNAGIYTVTVSDPSNPSTCPTATTVTITQPNPIVITLSSTPTSCNSNNGSATATSVTGGTGAGTYSYSWAPTGGTNTTASNLTAGLYSLTVTDADNCTGTQTVQVNNTSGPQVTVSSTSVTCFGASTGSIAVSVTGGMPNYTYSWTPAVGTNTTATNLPQGTYTVVVTDASPCSVTNVITIAQPTQITTVTSNTDAACGQLNGMASITVSGGTPGYTYTWSSTGGNTATAMGLGQNTYTIKGADANTCTYSAQVTVIQQSAVNVTVTSTPASCGNNNGTATAIATGGFPAVAGYTYTWTPTSPTQTTSVATNLAPDVYNVSVADSLGCATTKTVTVANHPSPVLIANSTNITCSGLTNGSTTCNINTGTGTAPFTYTWSPTGGNDSIASNLAAGTYTVNVTDSYSCMATTIVNISQPPALTVTATSTLATCGNSNGSTSCNVLGGSPGYTYVWASTGGTNSTATNLAGNTTYTVTVTDAHNCKDTASIFVKGTPALTLSSTTTNITCNGFSDGVISVTPHGGTGTITCVWTPNEANSNVITNLGIGTYSVHATDSVGCPANAVATITQPTPLIVNASPDSICIGQQANIVGSLSGENGAPYTYTWTSSDGINNTGTSNITTNSLSDSPLVASTYTISVQDSKGCPSKSASTYVYIYPPLVLAVSKGDTVCPGKLAQLSVITESGGLGKNYTVTWLPSGTTGNTFTVSPTQPVNTYTAVLSDGCAATTATTSVATYIIPLLSYTATPFMGCAPLIADFSSTFANGLEANGYTWYYGDGTTGIGTGQHKYNTSGVYHPVLVGTTINGHCPDSSGVVDVITVYPKPQANFTASTYTTDINDNTIQFYNQSTPTSATQTVSPTWNFIGQNAITDEQNPKHTFFPEGTYSVTLWVINQYGCTDSITEEIVIIPDFTFYAPNCFTPNGDGLDEVFLPIGEGWDLNQYDLWIFDRWGIMFHHTQNPYSGWDGTKDGHKVQEDVYVWKVNLFDVFGNPHSYHGTITVVK